MGQKDQELLKRLLATFKVEAEEHIGAISAGLIELEKVSSADKRTEILERVFREAHSLKGAARSVNLVRIESLCQSLEGLFATLKAHEISLSPELFDRLHQMVDTLGTLLRASRTPVATGDGSHPAQIPALPEPGGTTLSSSGPQGSQPIQNPVRPTSETGIALPLADLADSRVFAEDRPGLSKTVRVPVAKVDSLLRQAEEFIPVKATAIERIAELREIHESLASWKKEWGNVRPRARVIPKFLDGAPGPNERGSHGPGRPANGQAATPSEMAKILAFLDRNENVLHSVESKITVLAKHLANDRRVLERRVDDFVEDMKRVSMVPVSTLLESFPKLVRDLCRDCGKDAELVIAGGEIEADRRILEEMKDPLIHLLRNCIDHGIETAKLRAEKGKPPQATIGITISAKSGDKIEVMVADDGAGIDVQKVRAAATRLGLVSRESAQQLDEQQSVSLIFRSGVSTSPMITEVSGRGLGLAIVREKTEAFGGRVSVETRLGIGTTFRLVLPLTHARFRGVLVRAGGSLFVLPTANVQRVFRVGSEEVKSAENRETIEVNGKAASAVRLGDVLELPQGNTASDPKRKIPVLVVLWAGEQIAFLVDEILDEREVMVKSLGRQLPRVRNIAGATLLANGKVLPVLNVADLVQSAIRMALPKPVRETEETPKSILVAEDSITSRTLIRNILESAGYKVKTAVDGAEAFSILANEDFDLLVSDVEMPGMSGIDLTAKIRTDKRLGTLPVVLVTALDSRQDRERGADAGANAYLVKSSFDQSNLLEVVRRLI
jgi:two-component system, chemotaxis family, sensor kinase CheA